MERRDTNKGKGKGKGNKAEKENQNDCEPTKKERKIEVYSHCVKGKVKTFARCCYHKVHEARWERDTHSTEKLQLRKMQCLNFDK